MKIFANQLSSSLTQKTYTNYLVFGNEPLLRQESLDLISSHLVLQAQSQTNQDIEKIRFEITPQLDWSSVFELCQAFSLFTTQKIITFTLPETAITPAQTKQFEMLLSLQHQDLTFIFTTSKLNRAQENTKWFKLLYQNALLVSCNTPDSSQLPRFVTQRCQSLKLEPDHESIQMLAQWHEGNLLALKQNLEKLQLIYPDGKLTIPRIEAALSRHNHFTPFQWIDALLAGQVNRSQRILRQLKAENIETVILLRSLQKELFLIFKMQQQIQIKQASVKSLFDHYKIWQTKRPLYQAALQRLSLDKLRILIHHLTRLEVTLKTDYEADTWPQLQQVSVLMM